MRLRLVQLPAQPALGVFPSYRLAAAVQELVRRQFLHAKESEARQRRRPADSHAPGSDPEASADTLLSLLVQPPPPTIIAFTPPPTYTLGRRQDAAQLRSAERARLQAPLALRIRDGDNDGDDASHSEGDASFVALPPFVPSIVSTLRGGLTTYHGPGQAVLWPVLDLKSRHFHRATPLTVRAYSRLLETTTADVLRRRFGLEAYTTADPGLWVRSPIGSSGDGNGGNGGNGGSSGGRTEERKIAALGVHLRRNVSALGVAVNLDTPVTWAQGGSARTQQEEANPWARFVPCGLDGKGVSCVADEGRLRFGGHVPAAWDLQAAPFAAKWAAAFAVHLGLSDPDVDIADAATVARLMVEAEELMACEVAEDGS